MDRHQIPNALVLTIIATFYVGAAFAGWPVERIAVHTIAGLIALVVLLAGMNVGYFGGGIVKLCAALVLVFGAQSGIYFITLSFGSLGMIVLLLHLVKMRPGKVPFLPFAAFAALIVSQPHEWIRLIF